MLKKKNNTVIINKVYANYMTIFYLSIVFLKKGDGKEDNFEDFRFYDYAQ